MNANPRAGDGDATKRELDRRQFLRSMGVLAAGGMLADLGLFDQSAGAASSRARQPNIIMLLVDELRFPSVFPEGIRTPEQFIKKFMPNTYELWRHGVKFMNHHTAGMACSPARASLVTGLYPHQHWELATRAPQGPQLQTQYPTYGRLLRQLGYHTPYIGKWHLSNTPPNGGTTGYLERYGFRGLTNPDPRGQNGEGAARDPGIGDQAVSWLENQSRSHQPYCLTVGFVNPHDRQFFWAGTEGTHYEQLFEGQALQPMVTTYQSVPGEDAPPPLGYPAVPPNWESAQRLEATKPMTQTLVRLFCQAVWGAITDDRNQTGFSVQSSPFPGNVGLGVAPFSYWSRGLDMYTYVMTAVDEQIGRVVASVPKEQLHNTIFVLMSDHGEFGGAHGFLAGKVGAPYREAWNIPLVVADPSGRFVGHTDVPRRQLTSSVDILPLLVSLGNGGTRSWMTGALRRIYGHRLDMVRLLRDPRGRGREYLLFATDEILPRAMNYSNSPLHLLGVQTRDAKLCTYSYWRPGSTTPLNKGMELEFYDYDTEGGRSELHSTPDSPRAKALLHKLVNRYVPHEMQAPLPTFELRRAAHRAQEAYIAFQALANAQSAQQLIQQHRITTVFDWGLNM